MNDRPDQDKEAPDSATPQKGSSAEHTSDNVLSSASLDPVEGAESESQPLSSSESVLSLFHESIPFPLDSFQVEGCQAIEAGHSVLVSAPTGSGKTIVGEFAIFAAHHRGSRCFYTTPIKALSNQKYHDLVAIYGDDHVGLLTGDTSINRAAPIVVMTTEVLRNMIYADSDSLDNLSHVVMDEVHYLADPSRGPVWEEVILNLDESVILVALSATVSNVEEFGEWLQTVRGHTEVVVWEHRPVPLDQYMLIGSEIVPLFATESRKAKKSSPVQAKPIELMADHADEPARIQSGPKDQIDQDAHRVNPRVVSLASSAEKKSGGKRRRPHRPSIINALHGAGMLPAIIFIFSRAGCDGALAQCYTERIHLTTRTEAQEILSFIDEETAEIPQEDLDLMGFRRWRTNLSRGIAAHHAGMLPAFRHIVERLFTRGLLKVVFATETLALGINMPARTVVLESLVKFNGEAHVDLTPAQYTQLTGRAGRRGIDTIGNAVVLWQPSIDPEAVAGLASTRTYPLISTFRPGYNMSVNLLNTLGTDGAHAVLERSFAQFQRNGELVRHAHRARSFRREAETIERELTELLAVDPTQDRDRLTDYCALRTRLSKEEKQARRDRIQQREKEISTTLSRLQVGDVIALPEGRNPPLAVCIRQAQSRTNPTPTVYVEDGRRGDLHADELGNTPMVVGKMKLPRDVSRFPKRSIKIMQSEFRHGHFDRPRTLKARARTKPSKVVESLKEQIRSHPVHRWSGREELVRLENDRLAAVRKADRLAEASEKNSSFAADSDSLVATYDRMIALLSEIDYVDVDTASITPEGERLSRIHNESDLLISQCLKRGIWDELDPAELAGIATICLFENRKSAPGRLEVPTESMARAIENTERIWDEIIADETRHHLPTTRPIEPELATAMHQWTAGAPFAYALNAAAANGTALTPGDFVRWCRQTIDVLNQIKVTGYSDEIRSKARKAAEAIQRGVVASGG